MITVRTCCQCQGQFHPYREDQVACSTLCYRRWWNAQRPKQGPEEASCVVCGATFIKGKYNQKTCGADCRARHHSDLANKRRCAPQSRSITDADLDARALIGLEEMRRAHVVQRQHVSPMADLARWA